MTTGPAAAYQPDRLVDGDPVDPRRWIGLTVVLFANFMGAMDTFIVNVSAPTIEKSLHASFGQIQLIIASYSLTYGVGLVTGGRLGDLVGRRYMFRAGTAAFTLTSLACALAPNPATLIGFRLLQGFAAAAMLPQVISIIQVSFPARERGKAFGIFGAVSGSSAISGQLIGGLLIRSDVFGLGWRAVFMVNIPVGLLSLVVSGLVLRETKRGSEIGAGTRLDIVGVFLLGFAVFFVVNPLSRESSNGWGSVSTLQVVASAALFGLFGLYESRLQRRSSAPVIPLRLFRHPSFTNGLAIRYFFGWSTSATFLTIAFYLQIGVGLSPLASGLTFIPIGAGFVFSSLSSRRVLTPLWGRTVVMGGVLQSAGLLAIASVAAMSGGRHLWLLGLAFLVFGMGGGIIGTPINPISMLGLEAREVGGASGVLLTVGMIASATGVAVSGTVYFHFLHRFGIAHSSAIERLHDYGHALATTTWIAFGLSVGIAGLAMFLPHSLDHAERVAAAVDIKRRPASSHEVPAAGVIATD